MTTPACRMDHTATKIPLMYSFSGNSAASAPISTFMCLWAIYIVHISSSRIGRPIVGIYKSLTDAWMWKSIWDPDIPFLGIFVSKFRYFVFAVHKWVQFLREKAQNVRFTLALKKQDLYSKVVIILWTKGDYLLTTLHPPPLQTPRLPRAQCKHDCSEVGIWKN